MSAKLTFHCLDDFVKSPAALTLPKPGEGLKFSDLHRFMEDIEKDQPKDGKYHLVMPEYNAGFMEGFEHGIRSERNRRRRLAYRKRKTTKPSILSASREFLYAMDDVPKGSEAYNRAYQRWVEAIGVKGTK